MTIITNGTLPTAAHSCTRCGCVFEFDHKDVEVESSDLVFMRGEVECPTCNYPVSVKYDRECLAVTILK